MKQLIITQSFTNRDSKAFERYLSDVEKLPMIDANREAVLGVIVLGLGRATEKDGDVVDRKLVTCTGVLL